MQLATRILRKYGPNCTPLPQVENRSCCVCLLGTRHVCERARAPGFQHLLVECYRASRARGLGWPPLLLPPMERPSMMPNSRWDNESRINFEGLDLKAPTCCNPNCAYNLQPAKASP